MLSNDIFLIDWSDEQLYFCSPAVPGSNVYIWLQEGKGTIKRQRTVIRRKQKSCGMCNKEMRKMELCLWSVWSYVYAYGANFIAVRQVGVNTAYIQEQYSYILQYMYVRALNALTGLYCPEQLQSGPLLTHPGARRSI